MPEQSPKLTVIFGQHKGLAFQIPAGESVIGRSEKDSAPTAIDLAPIDEEVKVSRRHALVRREGSKVYLEDLGSLNGTYLNRTKKLAEGEPVALEPNDEIMIGKVLLRFEVG